MLHIIQTVLFGLLILIVRYQTQINKANHERLQIIERMLGLANQNREGKRQ